MGSGLVTSLKATRPAKGGNGGLRPVLSASAQTGLSAGQRPGTRSKRVGDRDGIGTGPILALPGKAPITENENDQAERAISTGQLHALLRFHIRPINVVVFHGSSGRTRFEVGFRLRCLQRLSRPYIATLHCGWRHNRSTRGTFVPVLSY